MIVHYLPLDQCCNNLEINMRDLYTEPSINFSAGRFRKQTFVSHERVVYHDSKSDYYLYSNGKDWIVSAIEFMIVLKIDQIYDDLLIVE